MARIVKGVRALTDADLIRTLKELAADERRNLTGILARIWEVERRRLYAAQGFPSLFEWCRRELRYSEPEAWRRIVTARAAKDHPVLYLLLASGRLSLTTASAVSPHLTRENRRSLLRRAIGMGKREVDRLIAELAPKPAPKDSIRFVGPARLETPPMEDLGPELLVTPPPDAPEVPALPPARSPETTSGSGQTEAPRHKTPQETATPSRLLARISFTADQAVLRDLERARALLRPGAPLEEVVGRALAALLERIDPLRRRPRASGPGKRPPRAPGARTRRPSAALRGEVLRLHEGRCAFVAPDGRRCSEDGRVEVDHAVPWAKGGLTLPGNLRPLCRAHNLLEARRELGSAAIDAALARRRARAEEAPPKEEPLSRTGERGSGAAPGRGTILADSRGTCRGWTRPCPGAGCRP